MSQPSPTLIVHVGRQRDGLVFELEPRTKARLKGKHPDSKLPTQVFVGFDTTGGLDELDEAVWHQVVVMLTGLSKEELEAAGGASLYEPWSGTELRNVS